MADEQLLDLYRYRESERFSELEKLVLDFATAMSRTPAEVSDELFAALREHFDERQLVELAGFIALENMVGRFNHAFAIGAAGFSEGMVCARPEPVLAPLSSRLPPRPPDRVARIVHDRLDRLAAGACAAFPRPFIGRATYG